MEFMTVKQVCDMTGQSRITVYRHIKSGKLIAHKIGGIWKVRKEDYENYIGIGHA